MIFIFSIILTFKLKIITRGTLMDGTKEEQEKASLN